MPDEKKFPFDFMKAVQDITNDTAEVRVDVINSGDIGGGTQYADGAARGTATGTIAMGDDGTNIQSLHVDSSGDAQVDVLSIAAGDNNIGNVDVVTLPALAAGTNNIGDVDVLSIAAGTNNIGDVDVASIAAGDNNIGNVDIVSGTITTVSTVTTLSTLTGGGIAHDSADSGNPIKVGMKAFSPDGTTPGTAVAENDRSDAKCDLNGRLFVNTASPQMLHVNLNGSSAYTDQALIADPGDGFQVVITGIIGSTGAATALNFFLEEGATKIFGPIYLEATAGRGFVSGPILLPCTASTAITLTSSAAIAQSFDVFYYLQAV